MAGRIAYYGNIVTSGLVLNLDAAKRDSYPSSGTTWRDISSNGNNGTLTNGPTFNSDNYGSIVFDGVDDWVTMNTGSSFIYGTGDFTLEYWFRDTSGGAINDSTIFAQTVSGTNYFITGVSNGKIFWIGTLSGGGTAVLSGGLHTKNTWNHAAVSRISGIVTVYLNCIGGTPTANTINFTNNTYIPTIGDESNHGSGNAWTGNISVFRLYNGKGLTLSEILQNYNATKTRYGL